MKNKRLKVCLEIWKAKTAAACPKAIFLSNTPKKLVAFLNLVTRSYCSYLEGNGKETRQTVTISKKRITKGRLFELPKVHFFCL